MSAVLEPHQPKVVNKSSERILPVQDIYTSCYTEDQSEYFDRLHSVLTSFMHPETSLFNSLKIELPDGISYFQLGSDLPSLNLLQFIIKLGSYKRVLEIGTFVGVSAMHLAEAAGPGCEVFTFEVGKDFYEIASRNIKNNGFADRVKVIHANANSIGEFLQNQPPFDFIFIDGDKGKYCELFKMLLPHLNLNGIILIDDALFHGDVLNDIPTTEKGLGVKNALEEVAMRRDVQAVLLPIGNGKLMIRKV